MTTENTAPDLTPVPPAPTVSLQDWDWDAQGFKRTDYPAEPVVEFMDWLRTTKAWHGDLELVHLRLRKLNQRLAAHRQRLAEAKAQEASLLPLVSDVLLHALPVKPKRSHKKKVAPVPQEV